VLSGDKKNLGKPLRTLLVKLILETAITFEERSYRYYEAALEKSIMEESFELLKKLMGQELYHRIMLEEMQRRGSVFETKSLNTPWFTDEGPALEEVDSLCDEWPEISQRDSKRVILERALEKERCAYRFYKRMMERSRSEDLRQLFQTLMKEESYHAQAIEKELERITT
jgi:rubrerythrin